MTSSKEPVCFSITEGNSLMSKRTLLAQTLISANAFFAPLNSYLLANFISLTKSLPVFRVLKPNCLALSKISPNISLESATDMANFCISAFNSSVVPWSPVSIVSPRLFSISALDKLIERPVDSVYAFCILAISSKVTPHLRIISGIR